MRTHLSFLKKSLKRGMHLGIAPLKHHSEKIRDIDSSGHSLGDELYVQLARRLHRNLRESRSLEQHFEALYRQEVQMMGYGNGIGALSKDANVETIATKPSAEHKPARRCYGEDRLNEFERVEDVLDHLEACDEIPKPCRRFRVFDRNLNDLKPV